MDETKMAGIDPAKQATRRAASCRFSDVRSGNCQWGPGGAMHVDLLGL